MSLSNLSKYLTTVFLLAVVCFFVLVETSFATRPPTPPYTKVWGDSLDGLRAIRIDYLSPFPRRDLDNYIGQFERTCEFLDSMQEHNEEDDEFGGLHEGEGNILWGIVETDNTCKRRSKSAAGGGAVEKCGTS